MLRFFLQSQTWGDNTEIHQIFIKFNHSSNSYLNHRGSRLLGEGVSEYNDSTYVCMTLYVHGYIRVFFPVWSNSGCVRAFRDFWRHGPRGFHVGVNEDAVSAREADTDTVGVPSMVSSFVVDAV